MTGYFDHRSLWYSWITPASRCRAYMTVFRRGIMFSFVRGSEAGMALPTKSISHINCPWLPAILLLLVLSPLSKYLHYIVISRINTLLPERRILLYPLLAHNRNQGKASVHNINHRYFAFHFYTYINVNNFIYLLAPDKQPISGQKG